MYCVRLVCVTGPAGAYGLDLGTSVVELLELVLPALPDGVMLKLGMSNPPHLLQRLPGVAACLRHPRMYSFVHVPVQSGSNAVLARMNREYTREDFEQVRRLLCAAGFTLRRMFLAFWLILPKHDQDFWKSQPTLRHARRDLVDAGQLLHLIQNTTSFLF